MQEGRKSEKLGNEGAVYTAKMVWLKKPDAYVKENCGFIKRVIFLYVYILSLNYFKLLYTSGLL